MRDDQETQCPYRALYVHVPFCGSKCAYCAFESHVPERGRREYEVQEWLAALEREAAWRLRSVGDAGFVEVREPDFATVFVGGGTPTFLSEPELEVFLRRLSRFYSSVSGPEVTVEANPDSLTAAKAEILRSYGVNRISLGVQSLEDVLLRGLGRRHTSADVRGAAVLLRQHGFGNINFDLMFGLQGQDMTAWRRTVTEAVRMGPEHLSLYGLSVESGTPLACRLGWGEDHEAGCGAACDDVAHDAVREARAVLPDDDAQADMYDWAVAFLVKEGYRRYEISNFAREGYECRHNLTVWRGEDYIGLGPGAVSTRRGVRRTNTSVFGDYVKSEERENGTASVRAFTQEELTRSQLMSEYMILGLRTTAGVKRSAFERRFGVRAEDVFAQALETYCGKGVMVLEDDRMYIQPRYFFVSNEILQSFIL